MRPHGRHEQIRGLQAAAAMKPGVSRQCEAATVRAGEAVTAMPTHYRFSAAVRLFERQVSYPRVPDGTSPRRKGLPHRMRRRRNTLLAAASKKKTAPREGVRFFFRGGVDGIDSPPLKPGVSRQCEAATVRAAEAVTAMPTHYRFGAAVRLFERQVSPPRVPDGTGRYEKNDLAGCGGVEIRCSPRPG